MEKYELHLFKCLISQPITAKASQQHTTLPLDRGNAALVLRDFFTSDEQSEQTKSASCLVCSVVMPTQAGWYLQRSREQIVRNHSMQSF